MSLLRAYYILTKPGIVYGNVLTAVAGFLFAAKGGVDLGLLLATVVGVALVIASACVFNNYIDRGIDKKMTRTQNRPLVTGRISSRSAIVYGSVLGSIGLLVLSVWTPWLVVMIGVVALVFYVGLYGIAKRRTIHSTLIGSIPGAASIVAGYVAVSGNITIAAVVLGVVMMLWQMPHFYAIALFRHSEYVAAGLPVLPVVLGAEVAKRHMLIYIIAFVVASGLLAVLGYTGYVYLVGMMLASSWWLTKAIQGFQTADTKRWGRQMFGISLVVLLTFSVMISVNSKVV